MYEHAREGSVLGGIWLGIVELWRIRLSRGRQSGSPNESVRIGGAGADIVRLETGIIVQDGFRRNALRQQAQDQFHRYAHVADDGLAPEHVRAVPRNCPLPSRRAVHRRQDRLPGRMRRLPKRSTSAWKPGWITVVESISSTMAGPSIAPPAGSR